MLSQMPGHVWRRWQQVFGAFPFGPQQADRRAGMLAMLLYNANRAENAESLEPADFFSSLPFSKGVRLEDDPLYQRLQAEAYFGAATSAPAPSSAPDPSSTAGIP